MEGWMDIRTDISIYRVALLLMYKKDGRMDGRVERIAIQTNKASYRVALLLIYKKDGMMDGHTDEQTLVFI